MMIQYSMTDKRIKRIDYSDNTIGIDWQIPESEWIQSKKDKNHPTLAEATLFEYNKDLYA